LIANHMMLPGVPLEPGFLYPAYEQYLKEWREVAIQRADAGDVSASVCHQATLIDLILYGTTPHVWLEIMDEFLIENDKPIAYSRAFGERLYKYGRQYLQSTIHSIHTRWWIACLVDVTAVDHSVYANWILAKKRADGLFYDFDVSETILRHRMKSELTMSMAMAAEILSASGMLTDALKVELATNIVEPTKCPQLGYMTSEQLRLHALRILGHQNLFPVGVGDHIKACAEDLPFGWGDFAIKSKVDAYMGTAKRTARDKQIHSPLIACHVAELSQVLTDAREKADVLARLSEYARYMKANPLDIPAFQMRDVQIPFGADKTPIEAICASHLIAHY
jgi:hypothetical protein